MTSIDKPFSQACENNKHVIKDVLCKYLNDSKHVLEVGSGTGQHAVFMAANLPHLHWHCSDVEDYHQGINLWIDEHPLPNIMRPVKLKLARDEWGTHSKNGEKYDAIFTANTAHIMLEHEIRALMQSIDQHLPQGGVFCQYGPFKVDGKFTSQSNEDFHHKLIDSGRGGYRDVDELRLWAPNILLKEMIQMPANNLMLVWKRSDM